MKLKKYLWTIAAATMAFTSACSDDDTFNAIEAAPEPPVPEIVPEAPTIKPKAMWIDAHANLQRLATKQGIDTELQKIKDCGLNLIYLDVKPNLGYALYDSDILPHLTKWNDITVNRDFDYLGYFIEKCEELDIDVVASASACGWGDISTKTGFVFDNYEEWAPRCQTRMDGNDPNKLVRICDETGKDGAMLDPAVPEVADLIVNMYAEIVSKYPKLKGISIDYLRYYNGDDGYYGMSDYDLSAYNSYWGESATRDEFVTATNGLGPKFAKWVEFRSAAVTSVLSRINSTVKAINPDCEIHLWASADWRSRYTVGQNWASKRYMPSGLAYTPTYNKTGFADLLDVFVTGAYSEKVWISEDPSTVWTVENFVKTWNNFIMGDCRCYGSIAAYALDAQKNSDATYLCLKNTDGYMTFELSHVNNRSLWESTKEGIERYEHPENFSYDDGDDVLY